MRQTPTFDIEASAVQKAIDHLIAIRPDLNKPDTLALAKLVATTAASETTRGLRDAGHMWTPYTEKASSGDHDFESRQKTNDGLEIILPLIEGLVGGIAQHKRGQR